VRVGDGADRGATQLFFEPGAEAERRVMAACQPLASGQKGLQVAPPRRRILTLAKTGLRPNLALVGVVDVTKVAW
jgi:transcription termination factor Rho